MQTRDHWYTQALQGSIVSLHASIVSVHGCPRLHFQLLKLLNLDFIADPDPAFHSYEDPDPAPQNDAHPSGSANLV